MPALATAGALEVDYCDSLARIDASALTTIVAGDLKTPSLVALDLTSLRSVTGQFDLEAKALPGLALPALRDAPGSINLHLGPPFAALDLSALETVVSLTLDLYWGSGSVESVLTDLSFPLLTSANYIRIDHATGLEHLSLPALASVGLGIEIGNTNGAFDSPGQLETLSLPALQSVGIMFRIKGETALTTLDVPLLRTAGWVDISKNPLLGSVSLPELTTLHSSDGVFTIQDSVDYIIAGIAKPLNVSENAAMTSLSVPKLATVFGAVQVTDDPALTELSLPVLTYVMYSLQVTGDAALASVSTPALTQVMFDLKVAGNAALASLSTPALTKVGHNIFIYNNPVFPQCQAQALADLVRVNGATIWITGNDTTATCP
jgi:hypothetical protein